jgi:hypothetical protein
MGYELGAERGYGPRKFSKVLFLADGAQVLWDLKKDSCRGTRREREALDAWVAKMEKALRAGKVQEILWGLPSFNPPWLG